MTDNLRLIRGLVKMIEDAQANTEGQYPYPDGGCFSCMHGTVPNDMNTGLCAYHEAVRMLEKGEGK
jgi:hypothetical protein